MRENFFCLCRRSNGIWYYYTYDKFGRRVFRSTGEKTKTHAMEVAITRARTGELLEPKITKHIKFSEYAKDFWVYDTCPYIQDKIARGSDYSKQHAREYLSSLNRVLIPDFGRYYLEELTTQQIQSWVIRAPQRYNVCNKTANDYLHNLRIILDTARLQGYLEKDPSEDVKQLTHKGNPFGSFTPQQVKQLFSANWESLPMKVACLLSAKTGMRLSEIRALTVEQLRDDYIIVNASWGEAGKGRKTTKAGYERIVAVEPKMIDLLRSVAPARKGLIFTTNGIVPVSQGYVSDALKEKMQQLGMPDVDEQGLKLSFHSFRCFLNTRLIVGNITGEKIRATIGHESDKMTEHYTHLSARDMEEIRNIQKEIC